MNQTGKEATMKTTGFTAEQVRALRANEYTLHVSTSTIRYTKAFKERFLELDETGKSEAEIFSELGYDPEILGINRIKLFATRLRKQFRADGQVYEGKKPNKRHPDMGDYSDMSKEEAMSHMQHEILYLHQELEFIKKILKLERSGGPKP